MSTRAFSPAHAHVVTAVRACPLPGGIFASCARDGSALLWDTRDEPPATSEYFSLHTFCLLLF